jgi:hypothetical protein
MRRNCYFFLLLVTLVFTTCALSQPQVAPKPQTARQALIEIGTKGGDALLKHLTVEVQDALKASGKLNSAGLSMLNGMSAPSGLQSFEDGDVLFAFDVPIEHTRFEVHVDNDDLNGEEDSISLSLHSFRDDKEQDLAWGLMSSHFTVTMKMQQKVWRVDKISIGAEFPVGDAKFIEKALLKPQASSLDQASGFHVVTPRTTVQVDSNPIQTASQEMPAEQVVAMLAYAESSFAKLHPEVGFTCSLSELEESSKMMGIDQQVNSGSYNGYHFALSGCEGKPAGSFQIIAEPLGASKTGKAFCTDATQNLRISDDGRGATCLASGKVQDAQAGEEGQVGLHVVYTDSKPKQ